MNNKFHKKLSAKFTSLFLSSNKDGLKAQLIKDGIGSLIINVIGKIFTFLTGVLLLRFLGKAEYGIYSYVLSLAFVLIIPAEFGISNLLVRETAHGIAKGTPSKVIGIWYWSIKIILLLFTSIVIASIIGAFWGSEFFSRLEMITFVWGIILMPFQAFVHLSSAALRGLKEVLLGQIPDLLIIPGLFAIFLLVIGLFIPINFTAASAMMLRLLSTFFAFLVSFSLLFWKTPESIRSAKPSYEGRSWVASALPLGLSSGLNMIKTRMNILVMGLFVSAGQIGTFQVAISTAALAGMITIAANPILAPQFASLHSRGEIKKLQRLSSMSARGIFAFNLLITIIFIFFGKALISFVFGADLVDAYPSLMVILVGQVVNSFFGPVAFLLNMTGYEKETMKVVGISTFIGITITLIITPIYGIIGAAISTAISLITAQSLMHIIIRKKLGFVSHAFGKMYSVSNNE